MKSFKPKFILPLLCLTFFVPSTIEAQQPTEEWVGRSNGQGSGRDYATDMAVDSLGNVYVTGYIRGGTPDDYATIKYNSNGNELWAKVYNGQGDGEDRAKAMAIDSLGNVYVTGYSWNGTSYDYATIKYDANGNELWVSRYNGLANSHDYANALVVDSLGNVYVTGYSWGSGTRYDYATIKYDTNGNQLWVSKYNGPANGNDYANALAVDVAGSVYVTGQSWGSGTGDDYATIKYDTNGNQLWVSRYNGLANSNDAAMDMAVDSLGNVYVTGQSRGSGTGDDYATIKYDSNGNQLWVSRYNGPLNNNDYANALVVDSLGNVYVSGGNRGSGLRHYYATVKYDSNGNELWVQRYNGPKNGADSAVRLGIDASGNVYVTGSSGGTGSCTGCYDYATIKYDSNGNELWTKVYNGLGDGEDRAKAMIVDALGNVYVTGYSYGSGTGTDYAAIKYDTNGNQLWVSNYDSLRDNSDIAYAMTVDDSGNVYVTGTSGGGIPDGYATIKYDSNGNQLWVSRYNGPEEGGPWTDIALALAIDSLGNVYITGCSWGGSGTRYDYATIKYDNNGNQLWLSRYNGPGNGNDEAYAIAVDATGNVYVTGSSYGSGTRYDYATIKYDTNGNQLWVSRYNGPGSNFDGSFKLAVDAPGNVYVTGYSYGSGTGDDYATIKYDTNGNQLWVSRYNGPANGWDWAYDLAIDTSGNVYVTGYSYGSGTGDDYATIKYDTNGNQLWVSRYNGPGNGWDWAYDLAIDTSGNVYVTGQSLGSGTGDDYATIKYDANGNELWVSRYDGPGSGGFGEDGALAVAVDALGNAYVTGQSLGSGTGYDYATIKYGASDTTPPDTTAILIGTLGNNGWYVSNVTVELTAADTGSGVSQIRYSIDGGAGAVYTAPFSLTTDGVHSISYYAEDNAGNQETANSLTVNIDKTPPVADAVVIFSREACLSTICTVTLDGSGSNDINGIVSYDWYEDYGTVNEVLLGSGASLTLDLALGYHHVTLLVTDTAGNTAQVSIVVSVEPALLSLFNLKKAEVEWEKDKIKLKGKLSLPVGKSLWDTSPIGAADVNLPAPLGQVVAQSVNFTVKDNGEKWEYKNEAATLGLRKFKIDWEGAKFEYKQTIHIEAEHLGDTSTTLEIERKNVVGAFSVLVGGVTISVDATNNVTILPPEGVVIDIDEDEEIEVELPFALTSGMTLIISGVVADTVLVSDYYTPAIGKFKIEALFDPGSVDVGSLTPTLSLELKLGEESFPGTFGIGSLDWKYAGLQEWKYKPEN